MSQIIIDCHGHYTTGTEAFYGHHQKLIDALNGDFAAAVANAPKMTDDEIRESIVPQENRMDERGNDVTIFSPRASTMGHHIGNEQTSIEWTGFCNDSIHRITELNPKRFVGVAQLPQSSGASITASVEELKRCVNELGFIGCNLNPDPSGGHWNSPPLTDEYWYKLYEKMVELDVPAMVHVTNTCNPVAHHFTGSHYLDGDTTGYEQLIKGDKARALYKEFPTIKFVIPHGGGAIPYHWGRYVGLAQDNKWLSPEELKANVFFDTCVYHQKGINALVDIVGTDNIMYGSETFGAVKGINPKTGLHHDFTKHYLENVRIIGHDIHGKEEIKNLAYSQLRDVFEFNARRIYPRINKHLADAGYKLDPMPSGP